MHEFCSLLDWSCSDDDDHPADSGTLTLDKVPERNFEIIAGGIQPTRHNFPQLIEDGLHPNEHLERALKLEHPYCNAEATKKCVTAALETCDVDPEVVNETRNGINKHLTTLAEATASEDKWFIEKVDPGVRRVLEAYGNKKLAFMREITFVVGTTDDENVMWLALGLPLVGWTPPARGLMQRVKHPENTIAQFLEGRVARNEKVVKSIRPTGDEALDNKAYAKTLQEVNDGVMKGPYMSIESLPLRSPCCTVPRHGLWEMHGDSTEPTVRNIDDLLAGCQNGTAGTTSAHRPTDVDALVAQARAVAAAYPLCEIWGWKSDYSKAFKQVPACPSQIELVVIVQWSPSAKRPVFFIVYCQVFGGKTAPLNFCRSPAWSCEAMATLFAVPASHCVDDVIVIERAETIHSGRESWLHFNKLCGWSISMEKSPRPAQKYNVIGVQIDLTPFPNGDAMVMVTAARIQALDQILLTIIEEKKLGSGGAAALAGKLGFTISGTFGRIGRSQIRPINRRAYQRTRRMTPQLYACLMWWRRFLKIYRPRPIPTSLAAMPTIISYSDGEGRMAGVGVAAWVPWLDHPVAAFAHVPDVIRQMWRSMAGVDEYKDIYLIEGVGPLLTLVAFPRLMRDALWIHFIDNTAAQASLISGSSAIDAAEHVVRYTWELCAMRRLWPYFDRVCSKSNPVDALSRGKRQGPWKEVKEAAFPVDKLVALAKECGEEERSRWRRQQTDEDN